MVPLMNRTIQLILTVVQLLCFFPLLHSQTIIRGPYLQLGTPTRISIRWRTDEETQSRLRYGLSQEMKQIFELNTGITREHEARLSNPSPNTEYYYKVGDDHCPDIL